MNFFIVNGKQYTCTKGFEVISGLTFKSGYAHTDVNFDTNVRSITDLIVFCISKNMSEKEIANTFGIDIVSIMGKVKLAKQKQSQNEKFFVLKGKNVELTDAGQERLRNIPNKGVK